MLMRIYTSEGVKTSFISESDFNNLQIKWRFQEENSVTGVITLNNVETAIEIEL